MSETLLGSDTSRPRPAWWGSASWPYTCHMVSNLRLAITLFLILMIGAISSAPARTVYRCMRSGTVSVATAPEPGSRCEAKQIDDDAAKMPDLWGASLGGLHHGVLYRREQDGQTVYSTRELPGSVKLFAFTVQTPKDSPAHFGLGSLGPPRLECMQSNFAPRQNPAAWTMPCCVRSHMPKAVSIRVRFRRKARKA